MMSTVFDGSVVLVEVYHEFLHVLDHDLKILILLPYLSSNPLIMLDHRKQMRDLLQQLIVLLIQHIRLLLKLFIFFLFLFHLFINDLLDLLDLLVHFSSLLSFMPDHVIEFMEILGLSELKLLCLLLSFLLKVRHIDHLAPMDIAPGLPLSQEEQLHRLEGLELTAKAAQNENSRLVIMVRILVVDTGMVVPSAWVDASTEWERPVEVVEVELVELFEDVVVLGEDTTVDLGTG